MLVILSSDLTNNSPKHQREMEFDSVQKVYLFSWRLVAWYKVFINPSEETTGSFTENFQQLEDYQVLPYLQ